MSEFASLAYFAEVPIVVWDVQRMGPSTGLPTRTSQGDVNLCYNLGHGDTKHIVLLPGSVTECFEFGWKSFDLAENLQTTRTANTPQQQSTAPATFMRHVVGLRHVRNS